MLGAHARDAGEARGERPPSTHRSTSVHALPPRLDTQLLLRFSDGTEIIIFVKKLAVEPFDLDMKLRVRSEPT